RALRDQQRRAVAAQRAAGVEQHIVARAIRVGVKTELGDVHLMRECRLVQRFHVGHANRELEPFEVDPPIDDRVEHEAVVRTRGEAQREFHWRSRILRAAAFRLSIASASFHASRLRRSTTFETARTWANGTAWMRHAYMKAAPSMLSTCGLN